MAAHGMLGSWAHAMKINWMQDLERVSHNSTITHNSTYTGPKPTTIHYVYTNLWILNLQNNAKTFHSQNQLNQM